jgi:hypothetical protein
MPGIAQVLSASAGEVVVKKWIHLSARKKSPIPLAVEFYWGVSFYGSVKIWLVVPVFGLSLLS